MAQRSSQRSSRKGKSFLNNPVVLIIIVLVLLVAAASSMGFLNQFIPGLSNQASVQNAAPTNVPARPAPAQPENGPQSGEPSDNPAPGQQAVSQPASPEKQTQTAQGKTPPAGPQSAATGQPVSAQPASKKVEPAKSGQTQANSASPAGKVSTPSQAKTVTAMQPGQAAQPVKKPADTAQKKPKPEVPAFSFKVGRSNPFSPFRGSPQPRQNVITSPSKTQPQASKRPSPVDSSSNNTTPKEPAKPTGPRSWRYTGYSANGPHRFAVIETSTNAYIVSIGDRIEGTWLVVEVTGDHVTIKNADQTIVLPMGGDGK